VSKAKSSAWICPKCSQKKRAFSLHHLRACKGGAARVTPAPSPTDIVATEPTVSPLDAAWAEADRLENEARADSAEADRWIKIAQDKYAAHVHARGYARTLGPRPVKVPT
jgi:hypothetical protein